METNFVEIGKNIVKRLKGLSFTVKKLKGSSLTTKVVGSLLYSKLDKVN